MSLILIMKLLKGTLKVLLASILILGSVGYTEAAELVFYGVDSKIENSTLKTSLTITIDEQINKLFFYVTPIPEIRKFSITSGDVSCKSADTRGGISCDISNLNESGGTISLDLDSRLKLGEGKADITSSYEIPFNARSVYSSLRLPPRAVLSEDPPQNSISPRNGEVKTDGKHIIVFWTKGNITAGDVLTFSASYSLLEQRESPINTLLLVPIVVILTAFVWLVIRHKRTTKTIGQTAAVSVLSKDEKTLFDILKAHDNKVNQKILVRESNFSKAKVSRLIKELRDRGVIEIEAISGRENRILLKLGQANNKKEGGGSAETNKQETDT